MTNDDLLAETSEVAHAFLEGRVTLASVQCKLQAVRPLLERVGDIAAIVDALTDAEADLEAIAFTTFGDQTRPAATSVVRELLVVLDGRGPGR